MRQRTKYETLKNTGLYRLYECHHGQLRPQTLFYVQFSLRRPSESYCFALKCMHLTHGTKIVPHLSLPTHWFYCLLYNTSQLFRTHRQYCMFQMLPHASNGETCCKAPHTYEVVWVRISFGFMEVSHNTNCLTIPAYTLPSNTETNDSTYLRNFSFRKLDRTVANDTG